MKLYQLGEKLRFHAGFRGRYYLSTGWSNPEPNECWSDGPEAEICLRFRSLSRNSLVLWVQCSGYLAGGSLEHQEVDVFANDQGLGRLKVTTLAWHKVLIPRRIIQADIARIKFAIATPVCPAEKNISIDTRYLGISIKALVVFEDLDIDLTCVKKIGAGEDLMGDVFYSSGGFYRAIKVDSLHFYETLIKNRAFEQLMERRLVPDQFSTKIIHVNYSYLSSAVTGYYISPISYPLYLMRDAAYAWISINDTLMNISETLGLCDGHYGNFVQFENATPMWCDIGSITNKESGIAFGYLEFVRCFVIPLVMFSFPNEMRLDIRQMMHDNPQGISVRQAIGLFGDQFATWNIQETYDKGQRRLALSALRDILGRIDFSSQQGFWSSYRGVGALDAAWRGDLLNEDQDSRYRAVMDLARKSDTTTFVDLGCNDGVFSLLCAREGMKGLAVDLDEVAINKLYSFVKGHPEIDLLIAYNGFQHVKNTADLVLALALTHHLSLSQGMSFEVIAERLAALSGKAAITEFMPDGLGGSPSHPEPSPNPLPEDYTLENFIAALSRRFRQVEVVDYARRSDTPYFSRRILVYCEK